MTDKTELKRLASLATPGRNFDRIPAAGGGLKYECTGDDGSLVLKVDHKNGEWGFVGDNGAADEEFFLACTPAAVLELIDENKRIKARLCVCRDCGGQGEVYSGHSTYQGHYQPPEPVMVVCGTCGGDGVLGPVEDFEALAAERDQLKAENEALRKDAERYRWLRGQHWNESEMAVVCYPKKAVKLGFDCPSEGRLDSAIDAALGKGEQS